MREEKRITAALALFYLIYILLFLSKFGLNPSAAIELSEGYVQSYGLDLPEGTIVYEDSPGYDGQIFYSMAADLTNSELGIDAFRYQRILYPFVVFILSAGIKGIIPLMLLAVNYVSVVFGTYLLLLILRKRGLSLKVALLWAFNVGFFITVIRDLAEPLLFLFVISSVYLLEEKRHLLSGLSLSFAVLTKEYAVIIVLPLLAYYLAEAVSSSKRREGLAGLIHSLAGRRKQLVSFCLPLIVLASWQSALHFLTGEVPMLSSGTRLGLPLAGFIGYLMSSSVPSDFLGFYTEYGVITVLLFCVSALYALFREGMARLHPYFLVLCAQAIFLFSLSERMYGSLLDSIGRMSMGFFLFTALYFPKGRYRHLVPLLLLMAVMSGTYFIIKIVLFDPAFIVTLLSWIFRKPNFLRPSLQHLLA